MSVNVFRPFWCLWVREGRARGLKFHPTTGPTFPFLFLCSKPWRENYLLSPIYQLWSSLIAQLGKNLPAVQETWVWFLGREDSPGEGNGNPLQYSCLENLTDRGALGDTVHRVARVRHDLAPRPPPPFTSTKTLKAISYSVVTVQVYVHCLLDGRHILQLTHSDFMEDHCYHPEWYRWRNWGMEMLWAC